MPGRLTNLGFAEIHFGMLLLEFLENVGLLLFLARGLAEFLLTLVEHHLLDHAACLAVQVTQLAVVGLDLGHIDLGGRSHDVRPPLHLIDLVQMYVDGLGAAWRRGQCPGAVVGVDCVGEVALLGLCKLYCFHRGFDRIQQASEQTVVEGNTYANDRVLSLDPRNQLLLLDIHHEIPALQVTRHDDADIELADVLGPLVGEGSLLFCLLCAGGRILLGCGIW